MSKADDDQGCFLCDALSSGEDAKTGILFRGDATFVILNAYPYNTGHVMVAPNAHLGELHDLSGSDRHELMDMVDRAIGVLREGLSPHGFNVGMNLGRVAGAGVPGHLHVHVVPRWGGDTNFMPVVGATKVLPEMLAETEAKLRPLFST